MLGQWCLRVNSRELNYLFIKTKLNVWPVALVTASRMCSKVGVHGLARRWTPEKEYISPSSPYVACFLGTLYDFPYTCTLALSPLSHEKNKTFQTLDTNTISIRMEYYNCNLAHSIWYKYNNEVTLFI